MSYYPQQPVPVAPLHYGYPVRRGRPGIITAMGVMSIVVAGLSGLATLWIGLMSMGMYFASQVRIPPPMPPTPQLNPSVGTAIVGGLAIDPTTSEDGLEEPTRMLVADVMSRGKSIGPQRRKQINLLLMVAGKKMFPAAQPGVAPQAIAANISESGRLPSAAGGQGPHYYVIGTGRVELYDDHAIFRPDGSIEVVSVSAPAEGSTAATQPGGSTIIHSGTTVVTGPGGAVVMTTTAPAGPVFKINRVAAGLSFLEAALSGVLAIYLLVIGILVLRDSRKGGRLHWIYVLVKIPLVIVGVIAGWWMWSGLMNSMATMSPATGGPPPQMGIVVAIWAIIFAAAGLAYPIALVFVLMSRTVRVYYGATRD